jgi:2-C-methyl-D-erythritol 4-phosphate cytidylyltransferase
MVVVLPAAELDEFRALTGQFRLRKPLGFVPGGETRAESVKRGLEFLQTADDDIIAVHDGVRPFVTPQEISNTIHAAEKYGAAILVAPAIDTLKEIAGNRIIHTLDRTQTRRALTPQCFRYRLLWRAYENANECAKDATDCSFLVESLGEPVAIVEGHARNIKITRPEDIIYGEILLRQESESSPES